MQQVVNSFEYLQVQCFPYLLKKQKPQGENYTYFVCVCYATHFGLTQSLPECYQYIYSFLKDFNGSVTVIILRKPDASKKIIIQFIARTMRKQQQALLISCLHFVSSVLLKQQMLPQCQHSNVTNTINYKEIRIFHDMMSLRTNIWKQDSVYICHVGSGN